MVHGNISKMWFLAEEEIYVGFSIRQFYSISEVKWLVSNDNAIAWRGSSDITDTNVEIGVSYPNLKTA